MALIGWWPLNGDTKDYTVNQNNGVITNIAWVLGKIGQAAAFNGSNTGIVIPNKPNLNPGIKSFTIAMWLYKPARGVSYRGIVDKNYSRAYGVFDVSSAEEENIGLYAQSGSLHCPLYVGDSYGKWIHCLWTVDIVNSTQRSYKNGVFHAETNHPLTNMTSGNDMFLGTYTSGYSYFEGQLNDLRIYDHILSQKEINDLAKAKVLHYTFNKDEDVVYDSSGYKRNGGKVGTPVVSTDNALGSSSMLVGLGNNAISFPSNHNLNIREAITINIWLKRTTNFNQTQDMFLVSRNPSWHFYDSYASGAIRGDVFIDSVRQGGVTTSLPFDGNWYMITYTYDSNLRKSSIYKNGVLDNQKTLSGLSNYLIDASSANFSTCGSHILGRGMLVDDINIYASALSPENIMELYKTKIKVDEIGNLYTSEFIEDYEVTPGVTTKSLFEDHNSIKNAKFESYGDTGLATSWTAENTKTYEITEDGYQKLYSGPQYGTFRLIQYIDDVLTENHQYYLRYSIESKSNLTNSFTEISSVSPGWKSYWGGSIDDDEYSNVFTLSQPFTSNNFRLQLNFSFNSSLYLDGLANVIVKSVYFIKLTEIFGEGNEPSKEELDKMFDYYTDGKSRTLESSQVITNEFNEIDNPDQAMKIHKNKIQISGKLMEGM